MNSSFANFLLALFFFNSLALAAESDETVSETIQSLLTSAEQGQSEAQFELGNIYYGGQKVAQDLDKAVYWYSRAGEQGNPNAQYNLGVMYLNGVSVNGVGNDIGIEIGVEIDFQTSLNWFRLAANQGDLISQYSLGAMYANGKGVNRDLSQAYKWFSVAAASGDRNAQANLVLFREMLSSEQIINGQEMAQQWITEFEALTTRAQQ